MTNVFNLKVIINHINICILVFLEHVAGNRGKRRQICEQI